MLLDAVVVDYLLRRRFADPELSLQTCGTTITLCLQNLIILRGSQTNDKIGHLYLPTKSPDKNLSGVMQKSPDFVGRQNRPILSAKIEHVLSSMILSADFFYIGQQILFMLPW